MPQNITMLKVDGYEIYATFAKTRNTAISGHLKQILLSSYIAGGHKPQTGGILAAPPLFLLGAQLSIPIFTVKYMALMDCLLYTSRCV